MANQVATNPLPYYERPPVVETILGVQFDRLVGFRNAHLGAFWKSLDQAEWPTVADAPPLPPQFERFTEGARWAKGIQFQVSQDPAGRLQVTNKDGNRMIQIQNNRLHFNWLGGAGGKYPRYESVRDGFTEVLSRFVDFAATEQLGDFRPNQWEVTYLNHIPKGSIWNTPDDWGFFLPLRSVPTIEDVIQGESFSGGWQFVIPNQRGRLHVKWQHGAKSEPGQQEMIILTLTARGPLDEGEGDTTRILNGVNLGRQTIVLTFEKLMSNEANNFWRMKHGND